MCIHAFIPENGIRLPGDGHRVRGIQWDGVLCDSLTKNGHHSLICFIILDPQLMEMFGKD